MNTQHKQNQKIESIFFDCFNIVKNLRLDTNRIKHNTIWDKLGIDEVGEDD